jgi:hypothetical protein
MTLGAGVWKATLQPGVGDSYRKVATRAPATQVFSKSAIEQGVRYLYVPRKQRLFGFRNKHSFAVSKPSSRKPEHAQLASCAFVANIPLTRAGPRHLSFTNMTLCERLAALPLESRPFQAEKVNTATAVSGD